MNYEVIAMYTASVACTLSLMHSIVYHCTRKAFRAWPVWDHGQCLSNEFRVFLRWHGVESILLLGVILSVAETFIIIAGFGHTKFIGVEHPWVVGYAGFVSMIALVACFFSETCSKCTP